MINLFITTDKHTELSKVMRDRITDFAVQVIEQLILVID